MLVRPSKPRRASFLDRPVARPRDALLVAVIAGRDPCTSHQSCESTLRARSRELPFATLFQWQLQSFVPVQSNTGSQPAT